jgi:hypothetical protein
MYLRMMQFLDQLVASTTRTVAADQMRTVQDVQPLVTSSSRLPKTKTGGIEMFQLLGFTLGLWFHQVYEEIIGEQDYPS